MNENLKAFEHVQRTAIDLGMQFGPKLVVALLIVAAGVYAGRWVSRVTDGMFGKLGLDVTLRLLLKRIVTQRAEVTATSSRWVTARSNTLT